MAKSCGKGKPQLMLAFNSICFKYIRLMLKKDNFAYRHITSRSAELTMFFVSFVVTSINPELQQQNFLKVFAVPRHDLSWKITLFLLTDRPVHDSFSSHWVVCVCRNLAMSCKIQGRKGDKIVFDFELHKTFKSFWIPKTDKIHVPLRFN